MPDTSFMSSTTLRGCLEEVKKNRNNSNAAPREGGVGFILENQSRYTGFTYAVDPRYSEYFGTSQKCS